MSAMVRAVLDSSVLVSALITPHGTPGAVLDAAERGVFALCRSPAILAETANVLTRDAKLQARYGYDQARVGRSPSPFAGGDWFDPLEDVVRGQVRAFIVSPCSQGVDTARCPFRVYKPVRASMYTRPGHSCGRFVGPTIRKYTIVRLDPAPRNLAKPPNGQR